MNSVSSTCIVFVYVFYMIIQFLFNSFKHPNLLIALLCIFTSFLVIKSDVMETDSNESSDSVLEWPLNQKHLTL